MFSHYFCRVKNHEYQICIRCAADTSNTAIHFYDNGRSHHCTNFLSIQPHYNYKGVEKDKNFVSLIHQKEKLGSVGLITC